jgi:plastocyanin domain-containing protein
MEKTIISIVIAIVLITATIIIVGGRSNGEDVSGNQNNVTIVDGKQIITINAKGGYSPKVTNAKAGIPTVIKINTKATFDCSSALTIPSLGYRKNLPPSGETIIEVPPQKIGETMRGLCAMGMYNFAVNFD